MLALELSNDAKDALHVAYRIGLIIVVAAILRFVVVHFIHQFARNMAKGLTRGGTSGVAATLSSADAIERVSARSQTIDGMASSFATWLIVGTATLLVLGEFHINLAPLLAGAGVAGIAVGFGAQNLVRDVVAGFFVLVEDQYGVGDVIDAGPATGTVERLTLRSTQLRDLKGTVWHIPNGSITRVGNQSQNWSRAVVEVPLPAGTDVRLARRIITDVAEKMGDEPEWRSEMRPDGRAEVQGVTSMTADSVTLRVVVDTKPKAQWAIERELRLRIVEAWEARETTPTPRPGSSSAPAEVHPSPDPEP